MNKKQKILVLDDDPDIGTMIKMMLEYKGYSVTVSDRAERMGGDSSR
jgi:DNA-binding response OmpR family regulator